MNKIPRMWFSKTTTTTKYGPGTGTNPELNTKQKLKQNKQTNTFLHNASLLLGTLYIPGLFDPKCYVRERGGGKEGERESEGGRERE